MELHPLSDRVLVTRLTSPDKTKGGLYFPEVAKEKPQWGIVVASGPGRQTDSGNVLPMSVHVGDTILFGKYSGIEVEADGKMLLVIKEEEIIATVKKEN